VPKSSRAEQPLEAALRALSGALRASKARWMVIGGVAVIAHGVQRMTTDLDAVIDGEAVEIPSLMRSLRRARITPRIEAAEAFATANLVLLVRHLPSGVDLDLSLAWTSFERDALAERKVIAFGDVKAPMATVEALLVFKAIAGRSRDKDDMLALLTLYPSLDLSSVRRRVVELAGLADAPELVGEFDALLRQVKPKLSAPSASKRRTVERRAAKRQDAKPAGETTPARNSRPTRSPPKQRPKR